MSQLYLLMFRDEELEWQSGMYDSREAAVEAALKAAQRQPPEFATGYRIERLAVEDIGSWQPLSCVGNPGEDADD